MEEPGSSPSGAGAGVGPSSSWNQRQKQTSAPPSRDKASISTRAIKSLKYSLKLKLFQFCLVLNRVSALIQSRILHQTLEQRRSEDHLAIPVEQMDQDLLAMYIRWTGHSVEKTVRYAKTADRGTGRAALLEIAVREWQRRGYPMRNFIAWAEENLQDYQAWNTTGLPQLHPEHELPSFGPDSAVIEVLVNRVSTRYWKPIAVPRHLIDEVLRVGCFAPTSCNRQTWKLYVRARTDFSSVSASYDVSNRMLVERAPVVIWIAIDERLYPEVWAAAEDAGIMGLQLNLAATALGLCGCLMYGGDNSQQDAWRKKVGAPPYHYQYLSFMFGYPAERTLTNKRAHPDDVAIYVDSEA